MIDMTEAPWCADFQTTLPASVTPRVSPRVAPRAGAAVSLLRNVTRARRDIFDVTCEKYLYEKLGSE